MDDASHASTVAKQDALETMKSQRLEREQDEYYHTQQALQGAQSGLDGASVATLLSKAAAHGKPLYGAMDERAMFLRNKRKLDEAMNASNLPAALRTKRRALDHSDGVDAERRIFEASNARNNAALNGSMEMMNGERPDNVHSAGRGLLHLSRASLLSGGGAAGTGNPYGGSQAQQQGMTGGLDSLLAQRDLLMAQNFRASQSSSAGFGGSGDLHHQHGGTAEDLYNSSDLAAAYLNRNQGIGRDAGRHLPPSFLNEHLGDNGANANATEQMMLRQRLAALQQQAAAGAQGQQASNFESLLLGTGSAPSPSMSNNPYLNRDVGALMGGGSAGSDPFLLRRAAELGLLGGGGGGGYSQPNRHHATASRGLPNMLTSQLFNDSSNSSFLAASLLRAGGLSGADASRLMGGGAAAGMDHGNNGHGFPGQHGHHYPSSRFASPPAPSSPRNNQTNKFSPVGRVGYDQKRYSAAKSRSPMDLPIVFPKRKLTAEEMAGIPPLPPCQDGTLVHFTQRTCVALATDEDENWLSEFLCFIRSELVEVFKASNDDVASRINSKKVVFGQVGIRCRYCAHMAHGDRTSRSSSFPSSIDRIYQSLTMMIRDHFVRCPGLPDALKNRFLELKSRTTQGATDSKRYWIESAKRMGMVDTTTQGIVVTEATQAAAVAALAAIPGRNAEENEKRPQIMIVTNDDKPLVSEFIYFLMTHVEKVYLTESERVGNRKSMELGMSGFGCKHCCASDRKGLCRFFPARRRTLPSKIKDLSDHLRRCTMCPIEVKEKLVEFKRKKLDLEPTEETNKHFFDRVWARLHNNEKGIVIRSSTGEK